MKNTKVLLKIVSLLVTLQMACAPIHDAQEDAQTTFASTNKELEAAALKVIQNNCQSCHGPTSTSGGIGDLTSVDYLLNKGLIIPGDSRRGRLMGSINEGSMPVNQQLSAIDISYLQEWIDFGFSLVNETNGNNNGNTTPTTPSLPTLSGSPLQVEALTIVQNKCASCHGDATNGSGGVSNILNVQNLIDSGLIVAGNPAQGRFMASIYSGSMPTAGPLTSSEITTLENWIKTDIDPKAQIDLPPPEEVKPTFSSLSKLILVPKCVACHGPTKADDGIRVDSYEYVMGLLGSKKIVTAGLAAESKLYNSVKGGEMPPRSAGYTALSSKEVAAIRDWIHSGAAKN
ncbi:MAG: hypothetical protein KDD40_02005 [Bdellovibrionales bacterium]|nr:hypothetical protein [Bdellovibrionales bacterium]